MKRGDRLRFTVDNLAFGGDAVGRAADGRAVFVGGAAPGDTVEAEIDEVKPKFARARLRLVVSPGAERVAARCPLVAECGGCQWQEVSITAQRAAKQVIVERALGRLGATIGPLATPCPDFGYRTRARFTVGENAIGYQSRRSHAVVDVASCPLLDPALDAALATAREFFRSVLPRGASLAGLVGSEGAVHLAVDGGPRSLADRATELIGRSGIVGIVLDGNHRLGASDVDTSDPGEPAFFGAADGFAQASASGNRLLRQLVREAIPVAAQNILELHAGDGNFSRDLAAGGRALRAIEGDAAAVGRLRKNVPAAEARCEPVERAAARLAGAGERFDLVLLDPPRAGARPILPSLARMTDRIVYISCDPMTLQRDAAELAALGFTVDEARGIDLMPHTYHVEVVARFSRRTKEAGSS
jgi:23S rRNA (uracil1939-C5)-methyltransferase